jgi:hypothetical protein
MPLRFIEVDDGHYSGGEIEHAEDDVEDAGQVAPG